MGENQLQIEVSCSNAGNSIDGQLPSLSKTSGNDTENIASGNYDDGVKPLNTQCYLQKTQKVRKLSQIELNLATLITALMVSCPLHQKLVEMTQILWPLEIMTMEVSHLTLLFIL